MSLDNIKSQMISDCEQYQVTHDIKLQMISNCKSYQICWNCR